MNNILGVPVERKGEPYRKVKEKARWMLGQLSLETDSQAIHIIRLLIESAPEQALDALCEVMDPDAE